jgi:hypothetical protein
LATPILALVVLCACSSAPEDAGTGAADEPGGACNALPTSMGGLGQVHLSVCSEVSYLENPPLGGDHYSSWAAFRSYSFPVPRGFWVHDLEHGAVVFTYNCAASSASPESECADEVARVQALIDALPVDSACSSATPRRVVLTPDPLLDVRWGMSAWGFGLRADCVDEQRFRQFYLNHFARGPEDLCKPGIDFGETPPCE